MIPSFAYYVMALKKEFVDFCNNKLQELGLSQGQLMFLIYIGKHDGCSPTELANSLHLDHGHTTRTISKLIEKEFIVQTTNPRDLRSHILTLRDKGKQAFQTSYELFLEWDREILKNVPLNQQKDLIQCMKSLVYKDEQ